MSDSSIITIPDRTHLNPQRTWLSILLAVLISSTLIALGGCSSPEPINSSGSTIIDVRTASEYAEGHLEGAMNIDVQADGFADEVSRLDKDASYVVYCRSGNRSATATSTMESLGFTDVTDAGGMQDASKATGLPIV